VHKRTFGAPLIYIYIPNSAACHAFFNLACFFAPAHLPRISIDKTPWLCDYFPQEEGAKKIKVNVNNDHK